MHLVPFFTIHVVEADRDAGSGIGAHHAAFGLHLAVIDRKVYFELGTCGHNGAGFDEAADADAAQLAAPRVPARFGVARLFSGSLAHDG